MPRETKFRDFGDPATSYMCTPMEALEASHMALEFVQLVGSSLALVLTRAADTEFDLVDGLKYVFTDGLHGLDRASHDRILFSFMKGVQVSGMKPEQNLGDAKQFNKHFNDIGLTEAYEVLMWSAEVNFRNHFGGALSRITKRLAERAQAEAPKAGTSSTSTP